MLVSKEYLWEHVNDTNTIILDTRTKIAYSYGHLKKSQHISLEDARIPQEYLSGHIQNSELFSFTEGIGLNGEIFQDEKNFLVFLITKR